MKITKITAARLAVPLKQPYRLSREYGVFSTATPVIVTVFTDEGITGYGECDPWPLFTGDSAESVMTVLTKHLAPALIGCDPCNPRELHRSMDAVIRNQHTAKSALDVAAYDLFGKWWGLPVHALLGGKLQNSMEVMWAVGGDTPEESASEVLACKEAGYHGCMIKVGTADWKNDAERTIAIRAAVGPDFPLIADANQGWSTGTAIRYARQVRDCSLLFFEQPVQSWDVDGFVKIRKAIDIPLSADESCTTLQDAQRLIKAGAADVLSIKVSKNGGILPAQRIGELADAHGISVFFNSMIEEGVTQAASLCVGAACENIVTGIGHAYFSPQRLEGDISTYHERIHNGMVSVSDEPGLGVELIESQMAKYTVETVTVSKED